MKRLVCLAMALMLLCGCTSAVASEFDILVQAMQTAEPQELADGYYLQFTRNGELMSANAMTCVGYRVFKSSPVSRYELSCELETNDASLELCIPGEIQAGDEWYITNDNLQVGISLQVFGWEFDEAFIVTGVDTFLNDLDGAEDYLRISIVSMEQTEEGMIIVASFDARLLDGEVIYTDGSFRGLFQ